MNTNNRISIWGYSVGLWLVLFVLLLGLFNWEWMHNLDARLAYKLQDTQVRLSPEITLIDVPRAEREDKVCPSEDFRQHVALLLQNLAEQAQRPQAIGLDIAFSTQCSEDDGGIPIELDRLANLKPPVPVYLTYDLSRNISSDLNADYALHHVKAIYDHADGSGHTWLSQSIDINEVWPNYAPCLWLSSSDDKTKELLMGLPLMLAQSRFPHDCPAPDNASNTEYRRVPVGGSIQQLYPKQVLHFEPDVKACPSGWRDGTRQCLPEMPDRALQGKFVIVGDLANDKPFNKHSPYAGVSGPEVVAWATSDLIQPRAQAARELLGGLWPHLGLTFGMALAALLLFVILPRFIRAWKLHPVRLALLAGVLSLLVPCGVIALTRLAGSDYTQVLFPILTTLITMWIAAWHQTRMLRNQSVPTGPNPDTAAYDIFVSYRHSHAEWVTDTLKPLLASIRHPDGHTLSVFYDEAGIHAAQNWATRLGQVIHHSSIFLAVLTPDYFAANASGAKVCAWEMEHALQRHAQNAMRIIPLFHAGYLPERDTPPHLPHLGPIQGPFSDSPELAEKLRTAIIPALDKD